MSAFGRVRLSDPLGPGQAPILVQIASYLAAVLLPTSGAATK